MAKRCRPNPRISGRMERQLHRADNANFDVVDYLGDGVLIEASELNAIEAFLMPLVEEILKDERRAAQRNDAEAPQTSAHD